MTFYRGIIEDNNSPKKDGRVRVRIIGLHSEDTKLVKTSDLPWAETVESLHFGFGSGKGVTSIPKTGTWVFLFLENDNPNKPVIFGAVSGKFTEPSDFYLPIKEELNKYDINKLALEHYAEKHVIETASGHTIEIDDFNGAEMIKVTHKTGTFIQILPTGDLIIDVKGKTSIKTAGTTDIISGGDTTVNVTGNLTAIASGSGTYKSSGAMLIQGSSVTIKGGSTMVV